MQETIPDEDASVRIALEEAVSVIRRFLAGLRCVDMVEHGLLSSTFKSACNNINSTLRTAAKPGKKPTKGAGTRTGSLANIHKCRSEAESKPTVIIYSLLWFLFYEELHSVQPGCSSWADSMLQLRSVNSLENLIVLSIQDVMYVPARRVTLPDVTF